MEPAPSVRRPPRRPWLVPLALALVAAALVLQLGEKTEVEVKLAEPPE